MKLKLIDFGIKVLLCLLACFSLLTCGIEEYYYLPQVSQNRIKWTGNNLAEADIPSIDTVEHYYARGYRIYYRIYLSAVGGGDQNTRTFSEDYNRDYSYFSTLIDPTNTSSIPTISTFSGRGYNELYKNNKDFFQLSTSGGLLKFTFPTDASIPYYTLNDGTRINLLRKNDFVPNDKGHEQFFRNTEGLRKSPDYTKRTNMDVASSNQNDFAYVAMYIVAVGENPTNWSIIYGKPTMISVFLLPKYN